MDQEEKPAVRACVVNGETKERLGAALAGTGLSAAVEIVHADMGTAADVTAEAASGVLDDLGSMALAAGKVLIIGGTGMSLLGACGRTAERLLQARRHDMESIPEPDIRECIACDGGHNDQHIRKLLPTRRKISKKKGRR